VIPVTRFQELKYFETRPSTDRCASDDLSYLLLRVMKREAEEFAKYGMTESMMARRDHDDLSGGPSTLPRFDIFFSK
ncbi:hypothetical protein, partial [Klebsiella pneumoniae]|uniref:hypothetical protein n=1 Tax=Klebsiella pneumoniae TaxID=573 RepID=UPI003A81210C